MAKKKSEQKTEKLEREYVIPLRAKYQHVARYKKTPKAVKTIKEFIARHMKIYDRDLNKIKIDGYLNETMWMRGIKNPPHKIKVKTVKEGDIVRVELVDYPDKLKFKKARLVKREQKAQEALGKKKKAAKKEEKPKVGEKTEEEKKEEKEKAKAGAEVMQKMEKAAAKKAKHQAGGKTKQPKRQQRKALAK